MARGGVGIGVEDPLFVMKIKIPPQRLGISPGGGRAAGSGNQSDVTEWPERARPGTIVVGGSQGVQWMMLILQGVTSTC